MSSISSFYGLQTSLRGLLAQQRALDVTAHNIANANTAGYSRQEASMAAAPALTVVGGVQDGREQLGGGVEVTAYRRIRDGFLDLQYRAQAMTLGEQSAKSKALGAAESVLLEPSDNGLSAQLAAFWSGWSDLANAPEGVSVREALVIQAGGLAGSIRQLHGELQAVQDDAAAQYAALTGAGGDVGSLAASLRDLNAGIKQATLSGEQPNDLLDRRDAVLDQLSALGQTSTVDLGNGSLQVFFGGAATALVDDTTVTWPQTLTAPGGQLGALLSLSRPGGEIDAYQGQVDAFAQRMATDVNAAHGAPFFTFTPGAAGSTLAVGVTATGVRAGSSGAIGANDVALAVAGLRGGAADSAYQTLVARMGNDARAARTSADNAEVLVQAIEDRRQSAAGVALDEEMLNLVRFQRGYQASARAMSALDESLDTLIRRTGRVGL